MGFCIKVFVYSSKEYVVVTISANNLVVWQKIRPNKAKKVPKIVERQVYEQLLGEFVLILLQFYQSFSIFYIEIVVHLDLSQIFGHLMVHSGNTC